MKSPNKTTTANKSSVSPKQRLTGSGSALAGTKSSAMMSTTQKQVQPSSELLRSFKATTSLAQGLTKERFKIQNEFQKISAGKEELEALKAIKKVKEPILTPEERASKVNKQEIKGTGFNLQMYCSEKGRTMIENQRDSRRQRHIEALKECEKFVEQFYDNFTERKGEIKERVKLFFAGSDQEVDRIMSGLSDDKLLANEIVYVNAIWEKVGTVHRQARRDELKQLRQNFDDLKVFQQKGSGAYLLSMRENLVDIAFFLAPEVDELIKDWISHENERYRQEHLQNDQYYEEWMKREAEKYEVLYQQWKDAVVRFHWIKQEDAIRRFLDLMESKRFVNAQTRCDIFSQLKDTQMRVFKERMSLLQQLDQTPSPKLTKDFVTSIEEKLRQVNDEAQGMLDDIVLRLNKDMENTNEDADIALYDLKDFLIKNDAQLEEGQTFDSIIDDRARPTVERRKQEAKTLILNAVKYMEDFDYKMNEVSMAIAAFFRELATKIDTNKEKLKQTEVAFQVALAQCGDTHDEMASNQEDQLSAKVEEMRRAIHHVELNEKLQECFDLLDQITKTYRNYNVEYIKIVDAHPQTMDAFFVNFEKESMSQFRMFDETKRDEILALFTKETEERQKKLEEEALKKYEEEKKLEEAKRIEEEKKNPAAAAKGKAPAAPAKKPAGKGEVEKPPIDVPKLEVPKIQEFTTQTGHKYLIERSIDEISQKIMDAGIQQNDGEPQVEQVKGSIVEGAPTGSIPDPIVSARPTELSHSVAVTSVDVGQVEGADQAAAPVQKFKENDYLLKANLSPPRDPEDVECLHKDLMIVKDEVIRILCSARDRCVDWLFESKTQYQKKVQKENKELTDKSVDELDENLRKQWPRKGRLEVEIYQERKGQITAHNKKYERQVRTSLEKSNFLEEQWTFNVENISKDFANYRSTQDRLKSNLPEGKNLAELQGVQRKEKDSCQTFEEKCREYQDKLYDLAISQLDILVTQNNEMLNQCVLFEKGGNYSEPEIEWYRNQMKEINEMIIKTKEERDAKMKELNSEMEKLMKEPYEQFEKDYKGSIHQLSAKEGLGKTFGQPRRLAQEKLRGEMTRCEQAQKGIETMIEKVQKMCERANSLEHYNDNFDYSKEKQTLSLEIRVTMQSLIRSIIFYGTHLNAFTKEPKQLSRLSYFDKQPEIDLTAAEQGAVDEKRKDEELENLGPLGFKNPTQAYLKYQETIAAIEKTSKEICQKLYTGEIAKFLVGAEKIPEYLTQFMESMRRQAEDFRIGSVRQLREACLNLVQLCQIIPQAVFNYLSRKQTILVIRALDAEERKFRKIKQEDDEKKQKHLRNFRPNLENPANKVLTQELNQSESERTERFKEVLDDTQLRFLDIEQEFGQEFQNTYLNNLRGLIRLFDCLLYREDFIQLPGDEIIEKKHANIRQLTAQLQKQETGKRATRKWPGLGPSPFDIDLATLFDVKEYKEETQPPAQGAPVPTGSVVGQSNELTGDFDIQNTDHHKQIIKARNEYYTSYKARFDSSIKAYAKRFDELRKEEIRFNGYWAQNLKEITQKHI